MTGAQPAEGKTVAPVFAGKTNVPWYIWCGVLAATSSSIGCAWDVSWHRSIGRDTFWTPPHMAIYACGVLAAIISSYLIFAITFGRSEKLRTASVNVLGFRAPLGAFIAAWGGVAMLTSAPFDNWWHAAYGLDVRAVSPPHTLLMLGIFSVSVGVLYLILPAMNRSAGAPDEVTRHKFKMLQRLFLYVGGIITTQQMFFLLDYTWEGKLHGVSAYVDLALVIPVVLAMLSGASRSRWAATTATAVYTVFRMSEILILPLFPAHPKLGPVFFPVTHMVPAKFPVLIILPAIALDLLWHRTRKWTPWKMALLSGVVFIAVIAAVEWPFSVFLLSKAADNRFFGSMYFNFTSLATNADRERIFVDPSHGLALFLGMLRAVLDSAVGIWAGMLSGRRMRRVQR